MSQYTFTVTGMSCGGCEDNVTSEVGDLDGVDTVDADHESDTVDVVAEGVSTDDITAAIESAGYDVEA
jgi:copper chaperone